ncbi:PKD domain-containing protein [Sunxiuqinia elliptica]|uniref:PKD domain-containing protein n=1 Tax=Sunxiuqinia elliptica TaxID=655355 RepID=A0A1I2BHQ0_9BACT|nr:PKD domain-containing protein [Sunxiuqinia elliptica]SFE55348.1 PKD domain-containing protein [Sunxiuqinia elliptica]
MKNMFKIGLLVALLATLFSGCEPQEFDSGDIRESYPPSEEEMTATVTQGEDAYHFNMVSNAEVSGIHLIKWDLGNGSVVKGKEVVAYYPLPGTYDVTLTITTNNGAYTEKVVTQIVQEETDYSIFTSEKFIFLSGGVDDLDGKTWVLDSLAQGHLGVGPAGSNGLAWWSAGPLAKQGVGELYDDKINFQITGFKATLTNNGKSYVKDFIASSPEYSNGYVDDTDWVVDFTPAPGSWFIEERDGKSFLTLSGTTRLFPIFDVDAVNGSYEILKLDENVMELVALGGDGNAWHYQLIPEGYVKPSVSAELLVTDLSASEANTYEVSLDQVNIPAGQAINGVTFNFGDGDPVVADNYTDVVSHTYMRAGTYQITVVVNSSVGEFMLSETVTVTTNHPDYVPFLLDEMVMYNDFSEVSLTSVNGEDCGVSVVANPERIYPNRSANVAMYTKTNSQWGNANMKLPAGYRFDLRSIATFKMMVYGNAGDVVLLKLENTDMGGNAWQTGVELTYTIQNDNTWEVAEYDFTGAPTADLSWDPGLAVLMASDVTTDDRYSHDYYDVVRIMLNPGNGDGTHEFYFDELSGPHVEGIKSAQIR